MVQGRYRVGSLDLVDLDVGSPAHGSESVGARCGRRRVGNFYLCQKATGAEMCGLG